MSTPSRINRKRLVAVLAVFGALSAAVAVLPASATLTLLQPDISVPATFVGRGGVSTDGLGQLEPGGTIQAEVPAGSTVEQAYLYGTYYVDAPAGADLVVTVDTTDVALTLLGPDPTNYLATARADVTDLVAAKVGSGGGITDFTINSDPSALDGVALVVIYSNPGLPFTTVAVADGESTQSGDSFSFDFATPLEPDRPGFTATLALGSGYSYQNGLAGSVCGGEQYSIVTVNGDPLTSCAGNFDDGDAADGALITVGGVGDSTDNPADPLATDSGTDDELYNLVPFLTEGDTEIEFTTSNPSGDDNLFLAVLQISQAVGDPVEPPEAVDDTAETEFETAITIDVLANDTDPDDVIDPTTLSVVTDPADGLAEVIDGEIVYTPDDGFEGVDTFDYEICGVDFTVCTQATVTVTVQGPPPAPPATPTPAEPTFTG